MEFFINIRYFCIAKPQIGSKLSSSQYLKIVKIHISFLWGELIGPLFVLVIYEILSDLQYEIQYLPRLGFSFFMARNEC